MLREARRKMELLALEIEGAVLHGPTGQLASGLHNPKSEVAMFDAVSLAREVSPELALHYSRFQSKTGAQYHVLRYVTIRMTGEYVPATKEAVNSWLSSNGGVRHEMQVRSAIELLRNQVASLQSQSSKTRAVRHLRLINQELGAD